MNITKDQWTSIARIILVALLAIAAVLGYDLGVVQPRELAMQRPSQPLTRGITHYTELEAQTIKAAAPTSVGTATPALLVDSSGGQGNLFELRQNATPVLQIDKDGNITHTGDSESSGGQDFTGPVSVAATPAATATPQFLIHDVGAGMPLEIRNAGATPVAGIDNAYNLTAASADIGGGYGSTGCTTTTAGVLWCSGGMMSDSSLIADSATITNALSVGGGYGSTGCTTTTAGVQWCAGGIMSDSSLIGDSATITNALSVGGGYGSTGCTTSTAGVLQCDGAMTASNSVLTQTTTADSYTQMTMAYWEAGQDMAAGGSNGIYAWSNPVEDVQNTYGLRARMDLRKASGAVAVNQLHAVDALINLNETQTYTVVDNVSVIGAAIHGGTSGDMAGSSSLNLFYGAWGPTAAQDLTAETNGLLILTHAETDVDYGVHIESSSNMDAGIFLDNHTSNSPAQMDIGIEMVSASENMISGIDMSAADFTGSDIVFSNGEYISNITDGQLDVGLGDVVLATDATGGNLGAKNEYIGIPRIKLFAVGAGTNPNSQTIALFDDSPTGEWAPVDASVTEANTTTVVKYGTNAYHAAWAAGAAATDGIIDADLGAAAAWDDMESCGLLVQSSVTWASGDLTLVLTDNGGARTFNIPALTETDTWVWLEVDISSGDLSAISDVAILMSTQGATALGAFDMYIDIAWVWDSTDEETLGVALQPDGILGVIDPADGTVHAELTNYLIHYEDGNDFLVWITNESGAYNLIMLAY